MDQNKRHLFLVTQPADAVSEGPITRLSLWPRFEPVTHSRVAIFILSKLLLLATVFYFVYSI